MNPQEKEQEIMKRFLDLPEDVQKSLFSSITNEAILEVAKKHELTVEKIGELADETGLVMLGMTRPNEFIKNLERRLELPAAKAKEVAEDINQKVFFPIRESLKQIHGIDSIKKASEEKNETPIVETNKKSLPPIKKLEVKENEETIKEIKPLPNKTSLPIKIMMPEHPPEVKVGEIAKPTEPQFKIIPKMAGRIETLSNSNQFQNVSLSPQEKHEEEIPDIFLKNIPQENSSILQLNTKPGEEIKKDLETILNGKAPIKPEKEKNSVNNDPYKEPI